jgi:cytochrome c oxidase assembly factor CtaG
MSSFFSGYQKPLVTLLLIIAGLVSVYVTLAVLDALDDIPLLAPVLELVGLGYTGWFIWRYLLRASTREELWAELESYFSQIMGKNSQS